MDFRITPTHDLNGELFVPGDKSISHRALILSALADGQSRLNGFLMGADNFATVSAFQKMGVTIEVIEDEGILLVNGVGVDGLRKPPDVLDLGNSGTAMRLLCGLLAAQSFDSVLTGDESLRRRPMKRIVEPLIQMGAKIEMSTGNTPPLKIHGGKKLSGIDYILPIPSAQVKSGILLAGLYAKGKTCVVESEPSRDHTERLLNAFHYPIHRAKGRICVSGGGRLRATPISIPGDISSAAFFIVAATITPGSSIVLRKVGVNPTRMGIINLLKMMGADIEIDPIPEQNGEPLGDITVRHAQLRGIEIPSDQVPLAIDEFPILFVAAACASGRTTLHGAAELRVKESDRIASMVTGLQQLGIRAEALPDGLVIEGGQFLGGEVDSFGDHRIAMSFAIAGNVAKAPVIVCDCANVQTSFTNFVELASTVGMNIKVFE